VNDRKPIRVLCVIEGVDRPMTAMFIGLRRAGIELNIAGSLIDHVRDQFESAGISILDLDIRKRVDLSAVRALRAELKRGRYQVMHVFQNKALTNGLLAARGLPVHIVAYRGMVGNVSFFSPMSWLRYLNPRIARIVCVADAVRDYFLQMRPAFLRMPAERPVTIYKGHDLAWYQARPANLSEFGIPPGAFVVGCVANYRPRKGVELLVEAMGRLPQELDIHLLLVGHDMDRPQMLRRIQASPARDRIHVPGFRRDAPSLTAACDVFVLPSRKREGLARSLIEAMAYGIAPVVTDCGGSPELVLDGECGIVVPVDDVAAIASAIERLYNDEALRHRYGEAARQRIGTHFRIQDTIDRTAELYRELVNP
jgi:glycosyltransferase involved in cell wall biosynthesis